MKIEVLGSINSGKHNKGDIINLPDPEAEQLIKIGAAKATNEKVDKKKPSTTTKPKTKAEIKKAEAKAKADAKVEAKKTKAEAEAKSNSEK